MAFTQNFQSQIAQTIALIMESASTIHVFAKTIGEVKTVLEHSVQTIAVALVAVAQKDVNAIVDILDNLVL